MRKQFFKNDDGGTRTVFILTPYEAQEMLQGYLKEKGERIPRGVKYIQGPDNPVNPEIGPVGFKFMVDDGKVAYTPMALLDDIEIA